MQNDSVSLNRALLLGAAAMCLALSLVILLTGGWQLHVAGVSLSATQAARPAVVGCVLLLLATVLAPPRRAALALVGNLESRPNVSNIIETGAGGRMSILKRLLGKNIEPKQRVRVCVECGMPVAEHKEWCSILRGQIAMKLKTAEAPAQRS